MCFDFGYIDYYYYMFDFVGIVNYIDFWCFDRNIEDWMKIDLEMNFDLWMIKKS